MLDTGLSYYFRCAIPMLANDTFEIEDAEHRQLLDEYIPLSTDGTYSSCFIYDRTTNETGSYSSNSTIQCDKWVFDTTIFVDTVITEVI